MYLHKEVHGKSIFIVESHHHILLPWGIIRAQSKSPPNLLTFDHHPDTMPAFDDYVSLKCRGDSKCSEALSDKLIKRIDYRSPQSITEAINMLKYDEHIAAATLSKIIDFAFSFNLFGSFTVPSEEIKHRALVHEYKVKGNLAALNTLTYPEPPFTYVPIDNIFEISSYCAVGCKHNVDCTSERDNQVLESVYLDKQLELANNMASCVGIKDVESLPYIMDIDLDFFHSERAITPNDASTFHRLIKNAIAITIAKESACVRELKHEGSTITADTLLDDVFEHFNTALDATI